MTFQWWGNAKEEANCTIAAHSIYAKNKKKQDSSLSACIHFCQNPSLSWNEIYVSCGYAVHKFQCVTPAGADEHPLAGGGVGDGSVVVDEGGVEGHTVDVQGHWGELDTEWKMMPLTVTHLSDRDDMEATWARTTETGAKKHSDLLLK